ncbi:MAG: uncharacterized DUF497 family protein [Psychrobacter glaciei]
MVKNKGVQAETEIDTSPYALTMYIRFLMLGTSNESRVLVVCHCEKADGDTIRIISARKATNKERKFYEGDANER